MFLIKHFVASAVHLGKKTNQWNPRTAFFLFAASPTGKASAIHIIDLEQTILMIKRALTFIQKICLRDGVLLLSLGDHEANAATNPD
jgi:ribosomal protein S2